MTKINFTKLKNVPQHPCDRHTTLGLKYDEVMRNLLPDNDDYYIQQASGSVTVTLKIKPLIVKINIIGDKKKSFLQTTISFILNLFEIIFSSN